MLDEIESVKNEVKKLKERGIKIILALGHSGIDKDVEVAKNVPELSLVVGGHSHTFLYTGKNVNVYLGFDIRPGSGMFLSFSFHLC